jgi:hypothetical protein
MTTHITKTWFDGGKVVTKEIPESEVYKQEPRCAVIVEVFAKDWRLDYMSLPVGKHRLYTQEYVYTTPPAAQRQPLTDDEIWKFWWSRPAVDDGDMESQFVAAVRAVLAAHGIKEST